MVSQIFMVSSMHTMHVVPNTLQTDIMLLILKKESNYAPSTSINLNPLPRIPSHKYRHTKQIHLAPKAQTKSDDISTETGDKVLTC